MTNQSIDWSTSRLDDAITRIVEGRGTDVDWRIVVEYRIRFGIDIVMKAAQAALARSRSSRVGS